MRAQPAPEALLRPEVPDAGGGCPRPQQEEGRASLPSAPARPPTARRRARGPRAARGQPPPPGANSDVARNTPELLPQLPRGARPGGRFRGAVPSAQPGGASGGPRERGVKVGGEPEAGVGWIINTLGGIRHAGSRPARAGTPTWVPVNRRAGLKEGSV